MAQYVDMASIDTEKYISFGRNKLTGDGLALFWTGSGIELSIASGRMYVDIESDYSDHELMMDFIIEGERSQKLILAKGQNRYMVYSGMNPEKPVKIRIIRDTQCMTDDDVSYILIKGIEIDDGGSICEPQKYTYNIEFLGDSLTSGEGCGLTRREEWNSVVFDAVECYTYKAAEMMNATYNVISESGWGLYASYDANYDHAIPKYYSQINGTSGCRKCQELGALEEWDFSVSEMDAVVINLGTNDGSGMKANEDRKEEFITGFKKRAVDFLKTIREKNPACQIVWAYGMLGFEMEQYIKKAIDEYRSFSGDTRVEYLRLPVCNGDDLGVRFHPTPKAHEKTARCLVEYLQSVQAFLLR